MLGESPEWHGLSNGLSNYGNKCVRYPFKPAGICLKQYKSKLGVMKKRIYFIVLLISVMSLFNSCEKKDPDDKIIGDTAIIANHEIALESVLRSIPKEYIDAARNTLHIAYQHTSHGTHVSKGMFGLPGYKSGDDVKFGITNNNPTPNKLDFRDYAMASFAESGKDASDLSRDETAFIQATRNYLDAPQNSEINVVMWSWCDISGHDVKNNYLTGMQTLINEYSAGGSKIGSGAGKRVNPVIFIFMTGHANLNNNTGAGKPKNQAEQIIDYCNQNGFYCLDYYGIDTHDMDGNYWEDAGDDGNSPTGGDFYADWQASHTLGTHWYENRSSPGGSASYGDHNSQHITANRKAYAMWYILARIAGWGEE